MHEPVGVDAIGVYVGPARIDCAELLVGRGLDVGRLPSIGMTSRALALPFEDPVTHAVHAAADALCQVSPEERERVEILVVSSESGVDLSKSLASYVHRYLRLPTTCRMMEVKQACFGATGALQLAAGYLAAGFSPGMRALIVSTDVAVVDERAQYSEPAAGTGAVALLLSEHPRLLRLDQGAFGNHSYEVLDTARPGPTFDIDDADLSLSAYLDCLRAALADYQARVPAADLMTSFEALAFHTPFAGLVRAAHRMLLRDLREGDALIVSDFERRVAPSVVYPAQIGNLCSGSVYLALCSLVDNHSLDLSGARVALFSFGSGCSSEFFSGVLAPEAAQRVSATAIPDQLRRQRPTSFDEYTRLSERTARTLVPEEDSDVDVEEYLPWLSAADRPDRLLFVGTRGYHRQYRWR